MKMHSLLIIIISLMACLVAVKSQIQAGFYSTICPTAELIVKSTVQSHFDSNPSIAPALLRMHFHDCFVQGCDASILINGPNTERTALPNTLLRGFDVIADAKTQIEAVCPGVVSCADILAFAARDSVVLTNGLTWAVPSGRRDGRISLSTEADANLPKFTDSIESQMEQFANLGLDTIDFVTLVGGHTLGTTACQFFMYRLYGFTTTGNGADPSIDPAFVPELQALCPQDGDGSKRIALDTGSSNTFDETFFANLKDGKGILESDQKVWTHPSTKTVVERFLNLSGVLGLSFNVEFGKSMIKMGSIGIKNDTNGEIRKVCSAIN